MTWISTDAEQREKPIHNVKDIGVQISKKYICYTALTSFKPEFEDEV